MFYLILFIVILVCFNDNACRDNISQFDVLVGIGLAILYKLSLLKPKQGDK